MTVNRFSLFILIAAALLFIALCVGILLYDNHRFVVRSYTVSCRGIPHAVRFVFLSDLHEKNYGKDNDVLLQAVLDTKADAVLIGGDTIISSKAAKYAAGLRRAGQNSLEGLPDDVLLEGGWCGRSLSLIRRMSAQLPVYFSNGNHENKVADRPDTKPMYDAFMRYLDSCGTTVLNRDSCMLTERLHLYGLDLPRRDYIKFRRHLVTSEDIEALLGRPDADSFRILLAHKPDFFEAYAGWGADLVLSGHVHGGMVRLPLLGGIVSPAPGLFPKYSKGMYRDGKSTMIVSCGTGMHTLPLRFLNPAEVSVINLVPEPEKEQ